MKQSIIYLFLLMFSIGCTTLKEIPKQETYYGFDFTKYAEKDFLFTPEMYQGNYITLGIVSCDTYPSAKYSMQTTKTGGAITQWYTSAVDVEGAVDSIYNICRSMGADAYVNFSLTTIKKEYTNIANPIILQGVQVSGYAIKRQD